MIILMLSQLGQHHLQFSVHRSVAHFNPSTALKSSLEGGGRRSEGVLGPQTFRGD